ncbi:hypothetical protein AC579_8035 [Pseudocercospora musae]|uniref:RING-type domain-containing protein n=1 Tax=Pseudocercospora musae TaxID=113226 RepID=A0A139IPZ8_9PEZI|nr:hypothetical protein AC579_8035 [Pseudocercospora musae]
MAVEGLRRSTRARTQVLSYADEQAKHTANTAPRRRKQPSASRLDNSSSSSALQEEIADSGFDSEQDRPIKRQRRSPKHPSKVACVAYQKFENFAEKITWHAQAAEKRIAARLHDVERLEDGEEEHRLLEFVGIRVERTFHDYCHHSHIYDGDGLSGKYLSALENANKEKMFVLDRVRDVHDDRHTNLEDCPCETITVAGSKDNVYTVAIYQKKGQETPCKHSIYVSHKILKAPEHLKYQQAFLTPEPKELFAHAPRLPSEIAEQTMKDGNRKAATGDCPICFEDLEEREGLTWCEAACGNNLHVACFQQWERAKNPVTGPYCRPHWQTENTGQSEQKAMVTKTNMSTAATGVGGYANVMDQLDY